MSDKIKDGQLEHFPTFEKAETQYEKNLLIIYASSLIDYKKYISQLFERFEDDGKLTYDEMIKYNRLDI